jgi:hypothetical protein
MLLKRRPTADQLALCMVELSFELKCSGGSFKVDGRFRRGKIDRIKESSSAPVRR